jgi:predicted NAD/FAD-binding protein
MAKRFRGDIGPAWAKAIAQHVSKLGRDVAIKTLPHIKLVGRAPDAFLNGQGLSRRLLGLCISFASDHPLMILAGATGSLSDIFEYDAPLRRSHPQS